jgi:hypothetical protein
VYLKVAKAWGKPWYVTGDIIWYVTGDIISETVNKISEK